ncbi:MAG: hypothetical protein JXR86_09975 [Spirochaetales bacterium]|nr:hypothetical protein [Spirochaetales bacterium]
MQRYKAVLTVFILLFLSSGLFAMTALEARRKYDGIMSSWIEGRRNDLQALAEFGNLERELDSLGDSVQKTYWIARVSLAVGQIRYYRDEEELSLDALEKSRDLAGEAAAGGAGAGAWRIQSEAGSLIMIQKGVGYIITHSGRVQEQAEKALSLDSGNVRAALIVAQGLINAPALFGGNRRKGLADLEALSLRTGLSPEERFFVLMALGEIFARDKEGEKALGYFRKILESYPQNSLAKMRIDRMAR